MIDYVTLLLVNMVSSLVVLATFLWWGIGRTNCRDWAPAFGISGLVATVAGFTMTLTWPIPAPYSMAFGEMSVLLGVLFLGAASALACGWRLHPLGIYAFFPGLAAVLIGVRVIDLSLTAAPVLTGIGFIVTGAGGVCAVAAIWKQNVRIVRIVAGVVMLAAAGLWIPTTCMAYWLHIKVETHTSSTADSGPRTGQSPVDEPIVVDP
ncbi:MAG: DUF981 domain-containing protein [Phycisphaerales bacterium]